MKTILVVEDDDNLRRIFRLLLQTQGYTVLEARDGQQGLELALAHSPALILTDGMMPQLSGFEMLQALRAKAPASAPALFISAVAEMPSPAEQQAVGIVQTIAKPFSFDAVIAAVRAAVEDVQGQE